MTKFSIFVDGSNLMGSLIEMNMKIEDYEAFYRYVFDESVKVWKKMVYGDSLCPAILHRIYWYELGTIDEWDLKNAEVQNHLRKRFDIEKNIKKAFMALVAQQEPGLSPEKLDDRAWATCYDEFSQWYDDKKNALQKRLTFHHAIRESTNFIEIQECGHWKCDFLNKAVSEKKLDTTLAVDMIAKANNFDVAILITGDADSIPSIQYLKNNGKQVACVEFLKGHSPDKKSHVFSSHLKLMSDFVVQIYEMDLTSKNLGRKRP